MKYDYRCVCCKNRRKVVIIRQGEKVISLQEYEKDDPCSKCVDADMCDIDQHKAYYLNAGYYDNITDVEKVKQFIFEKECKKRY